MRPRLGSAIVLEARLRHDADPSAHATADPSRWTHRVGATCRARTTQDTPIWRQTPPPGNAIGLSSPVGGYSKRCDGRAKPWRSVLPPRRGEGSAFAAGGGEERRTHGARGGNAWPAKAIRHLCSCELIREKRLARGRPLAAVLVAATRSDALRPRSKRDFGATSEAGLGRGRRRPRGRKKARWAATFRRRGPAESCADIAKTLVFSGLDVC